METPSSESAPARAAAPRGVIAAGAAALVAFVVLKVSPLAFVDPDVFHQIALAREILRRGAVPLRDTFSYTPTLNPFVHHEWGTGMVSYAIAQTLGGQGFLAFKYVLVAAVIALAVRAARRAGASALAVIACGLPAAQAAHYGFTTIRAGMWSMVALAALLNVLHATRDRRRWALALVPLFALWINLHAGFVVGIGLLGLEAIERALRKEPFAHLAAGVVAACALVFATPYGVDYPRYLAHGLFMKRADITEWAPLWVSLRWNDLSAWGAMVALAAYGLRARGLRGCEGAAGVAVFALFALQHHRHLTLFGVLWLARVPGWISDTPLVRAFEAVVARRRALVTLLLGVTAAVWLSAGMLLRPWSLVVPTTPQYRRERWPTYPAGAVAYLFQARFRGNVMTPFQEGGYVMWQLAPQGVRVSYDSRYEAAYPSSVGRAHGIFYSASPGWSSVLRAYPTDVVLVPRDMRAVTAMLSAPGWKVVYGDDLYMLFARADSPLPLVDRRGYTIVASFP